MKYRKFGMPGWETSVLGMGVMQKPIINEDMSKENITEYATLIRYAIDHGINFLDIGYPYDFGNFEYQNQQVSLALKDGYRQRVKIAISLPSVLIDSAEDFDRLFNGQLKTLQINKVDFCLLGGLNRYSWPKVKQLDALQWAERAMSDGRIDRLGFSFHDDFQCLRNITQSYDKWAFCQVQYSFMDCKHHPGTVGIEFAADMGLPVVATEPLRWGRLTKNIPETVKRIWASSPKYSPAEWGLRWVWNNPSVITVVSDMDRIQQVDENIAIAENAKPDCLSVEELVMFENIKNTYREMRNIRCTACRCCMNIPCPVGIDVPRIIEIYHDSIMYDNVKTAQYLYKIEKHSIDDCVKCCSCERTCPRRYPLLDVLSASKQLLDIN
ncbi:MAG TPA: aldo/keto reductase [Anaerovoracaceae bacterium]|nr:aldo/keto reductase [Anaerovoracaceae bacterium]